MSSGTEVQRSGDGRLAGRAAVVTGVGSGLGRAIAGELAAEGASVLGCDVNDTAGEATMAGLGLFRHADVSREADVAALVDDAVSSFGHLDVMDNNAAIQIEQELIETTEAELDRVLAVNLKGPFFGCKHAVRVMRVSGGGVIVNVASILALVGDGILAAYCAPLGDIATPLVQAYFETAGDPEALRRQVSGAYPLGRIAQPREIARAVVFLASDDSSFMTGEAMVVDGGLLATCY